MKVENLSYNIVKFGILGWSKNKTGSLNAKPKLENLWFCIAFWITWKDCRMSSLSHLYQKPSSLWSLNVTLQSMASFEISFVVALFNIRNMFSEWYCVQQCNKEFIYSSVIHPFVKTAFSQENTLFSGLVVNLNCSRVKFFN